MQADSPSLASAASKTGGRVLVVDGDCPMCTGTSGLLVRFGWIAPADRRTLQELDPAEAQRMLDAGVRDELVALDTAAPEEGALHPGLAGILWVLAASASAPVRALARLAWRPPLRGPLTALYRFVAYNRRFLSTPRPTALPCACEPAPRPPYQIALIALAALFAASVTFGVGLAAPPELRLVGSRLGALGPVVKTWWPWAVPVLLAGTLERELRLPYLTHLAATAAVGAFVLLPLAVAGLLAPATIEHAYATLLQLACAGAGLGMFAMQRRRVAFLRLRGGWLTGWALCAGFGLLTLGWLRTLG